MANPNEPANKNHPDRAFVEKVAREEAAAAAAGLDAVLHMSRAGNATSARHHKAFRRIIRETGCSVEGLAEVWGCYAESIKHALRTDPTPPTLFQAQAADQQTENFHDRLRWAHGNEHAARIIAGKDPKTNADLAAWKRLGGSLGQIEGRGN
jgi:hypothetical protein